MMEKLYENDYFYILKEESTIPWIKIFTATPYKELSDCDEKTQEAIQKVSEELNALRIAIEEKNN